MKHHKGAAAKPRTRSRGPNPCMQRVMTVSGRMAEQATSADFEELVREVGPQALAIAHSMLGNRQDAEDALQDAFARAYKALPHHRGESSLRTWFLRILMNSCRKHRRTWRRWTRRNEAAAREAETRLTDVQSDPALQDRLTRAVSHLPRRRRVLGVAQNC